MSQCIKFIEMITLFGKIYFSVIKERENTKFNKMKEYYIQESKKQLSKIGLNKKTKTA